MGVFEISCIASRRHEEIIPFYGSAKGPQVLKSVRPVKMHPILILLENVDTGIPSKPAVYFITEFVGRIS